MSVRCSTCNSFDLRFSRFRFKDIPHFFILQYPMRCWVCRERDYHSILSIFRMGGDAEPRKVGASGLEKAETE